MDDNQKNNGYDDFFKSSNDDSGKEDNFSSGKENQTPSSYYYSYGPYKSQRPSEEDQRSAKSAFSYGSSSSTDIEMRLPRPVKPIGVTEERQGQPSSASWSVNSERKKSRWKSVFISFLAGAVVVGGLMFAADNGNWFTPAQGAMGNGGGSPAPAFNNNSGSNSGSMAQSAAWDSARPTNIAEIVDSTGPAVVKVETYKQVRSGGGSRSPLMDDPIFRYFFGDDFDSAPNQQPKEGSKEAAGIGTGFIFDKSGYVLTNEHVVNGADEILLTVQGYDEPFKAELLGSSYDLDLAVLKIQGDHDFPYLRMASSDINVGDWVVAIGNPYGFDHTVTVGVLSAKEREIPIQDRQGTRQYKHLLQTDASINPGNSGGPLLNLNGEVVGINTAVSAQAQGIGFAIPMSTVQNVLDNLKNGVEIPKEPVPFVGISVANIEESYLEVLNLDSTDGTIIANVLMGGPGFKAGLKQNDVILTFNGNKVKDFNDFKAKVLTMKVGDKVTLGIVRDGEKRDIEVTIGDMNEMEKAQQQQ
ncbi:trypsin-like peptidase domain-containing protein [Paenibacillus sp. J2TS4]|uniref:trypsin-like peptidase domain-containing protein n=1 Tax=Paenibacillus sp. J2TS4 TaxID=2807194 RepID=UPI001B17AD66|nr:trypsin-like peptidase domain-containing protein [Paenibacillus sp. J2TS4]GIP34313.1 hypothetical protein J2TS4_35230 [Paenibacillus sp. J2TS4]